MDEIAYQRIRIRIEGDQAIITFAGKLGEVVVRIPAAQLERWAMRMLRSEALT